MCLITIIPPGQTIPEAVLKTSSTSNPHGTGIAWAREGKVNWVKNIKNPEAFLNSLPKDCVRIVHDRLATVGPKTTELVHPFLVSTSLNEMPNQGSGKANLLFHNGHWAEWKDVFLSVCMSRRMQIPLGDWSDSKALSFVTAALGEGVINLLIGTANRVCILDPNGKVRTYGDGWAERGGCLFSNSYSFHSTVKNYHGYGWQQEEETAFTKNPVTSLVQVNTPLPDACDPTRCYYMKSGEWHLTAFSTDRLERGLYVPLPPNIPVEEARKARGLAIEKWVEEAFSAEDKTKRKGFVDKATKYFETAKARTEQDKKSSELKNEAKSVAKYWKLQVAKDASEWKWALSDAGKAAVRLFENVTSPTAYQCNKIAGSMIRRCPELKAKFSVEKLAEQMQMDALALLKDAEEEAVKVADSNDYTILS